MVNSIKIKIIKLEQSSLEVGDAEGISYNNSFIKT